MLQSLLRIRIYFQVHEKCCKTFQPSAEMIDRFKSSFMYKSDTETDMNSEENNNFYEINNIISDLYV